MQLENPLAAQRGAVEKIYQSCLGKAVLKGKWQCSQVVARATLTEFIKKIPWCEWSSTATTQRGSEVLTLKESEILIVESC